MKSYALIGLICLLTLLTSCCLGICDPPLIDRNYFIENGTNHKVDIRLYRTGGVGEFINGPYSTVLQGKGDQLKGNEISRRGGFPNDHEGWPFMSYDTTDSALLIFDDKRLSIHIYKSDGPNTFSPPVDRNLFRHANYEDLGDHVFRFTITEQDYINAKPYIKRSYIIENQTKHKVDIRLYVLIHTDDVILSSRFSTILHQSGDRLYGDDLHEIGSFSPDKKSYLFHSYQADSARLIFDEERLSVQTYNRSSESFSSPVERNIFRPANYEDTGEEQIFRFTITEQDYTNATPCTGNCE